ncbi:MAG: hypothetical protein ACI9QC_000268 [Oceanicoccus sp.]|jgi:hypothetical protein
MRHGYNDHYRFQAKNPFLGEGCLVFANGDDTSTDGGGPEKPKNISEHIQEGPENKENPKFVELYPGAGPTPPLKQAMDKYHILRGGMDYMDRINRYLQTSEEEIDTGRLPWSSNVDKIEGVVESLEAQVKGLDLKVDKDVFVTIRNQEEKEARLQMVQILASMYEKLNEQANQEAQVIHELYIEGFIKEYDELSTAWDEASPTYKSYAQVKKAKYKAAQDHLRTQTSKEIELGSEEALIQALQSYKHIFDGEKRELSEAHDQVTKPMDIDSVKREFKILEARKKKDFTANLGFFKSKIAAIQAELSNLKREVSGSQLDHAEKAKRLKTLKNLSEAYAKNIEDSDKFAQMSFSDPTPILEEDAEGNEKPALIELADGTMVEMPIGLKDRLDLLSSGKFTPDKLNSLATGINEEIKGLNGALDTFNDDVNTNLDKTLTQLKAEDIEGPITSPVFSSDFKTVFLSPMDIWTMITSAQESFKRSFDRNRERKVGEIGSKVTGPLGRMNRWPFEHFSVIPGDLEKKQTSAENAAVSFYQDDYKSNDDNSVIALLHTARNQDQFKACIQLLAERGRLNWFDPLFLKQINHFQKNLHFNPEKVEMFHANVPKFHSEMSRALHAIYGDRDLFRNLNAQTQSSYTSGKEKFKQELYNMARVRGGLQNLAVEMLKEHKNSGGHSTVNPQKFEYVIEIGIIEGAIQPPEIGLYFLIQAAANGLLPYERLQHLYANKASDIPYLEIFNEDIFDREKLMEWASIDPIPGTFETIAEYQVPHNYMRWFHTYVMHHPRVRGRSGKIFAAGNKMDSDLVGLFLPYASDDVASTILQIHPNGTRPERWLLNNASQYQHYALQNQLAHMDEMDGADSGGLENIDSESELQNIISGFIQWDSIMDKRYLAGDKQRYVSWTDSLKKEGPRAGFLDGYLWNATDKDDKRLPEYSTAYSYAERSREIISKLDPDIFSVIFKKGVPSAAEVTQVVKRAEKVYGYNFDGQPPETADALYSGIGGLLGAIIKTQNASGGTLKELIKEMKGQHQEVYKAHNAKDPSNPWGGKIDFYPTVDEDGKGVKSSEADWHITGSDS